MPPTRTVAGETVLCSVTQASVAKTTSSRKLPMDAPPTEDTESNANTVDGWPAGTTYVPEWAPHAPVPSDRLGEL